MTNETTASERERLKPCPFCGNDKNISIANEQRDNSGGYYIACPKCHASTGLRYACGEDPRPLLVEQWNRRAALPAPADQPPEPLGSSGSLSESGAEARTQVAASASRLLVGWLCDDGGSMRAFFRADEKDKLEEFMAECEPLEVIALQRAETDESVDLAAALEIRAILEQIKEVAAIYQAADMPTPFQSVWQGCCEEIFFRATGCQWHMDEDDGRRRVDGPTAGQQIVERALAAREPSADAALKDAEANGGMNPGESHDE